MYMLSEFLDYIICNVRIYVNGKLLYEGAANHFEGSAEYKIEYVSNSMSYETRDHGEAFDLFAVNGFVDIYVS